MTNDNSPNVCMTDKPRTALPYAGDVTPAQAFAAINEKNAVLIDVRTPQEWAQGQPDMPKMHSISYKTLPEYQVNPQFTDQLMACGIDKKAPIYFMCKGGGRSQEAAMLMTAHGYENCYNIAGGFEGRPDVKGWRESQLPCKKG